MSNKSTTGVKDEESPNEWTQTDDLFTKLQHVAWMGGLYGVGVLFIQLIFLWNQSYLQATVWFVSALIVWVVIVDPRNANESDFFGGTDNE